MVMVADSEIRESQLCATEYENSRLRETRVNNLIHVFPERKHSILQ